MSNFINLVMKSYAIAGKDSSFDHDHPVFKMAAHIDKLNDDVRRLTEFGGRMGVALRDEDVDGGNEAWRALPDHLQNAINEVEKQSG